MRCPSCRADNDYANRACGSCGAPLSRRSSGRRRAVPAEGDSPFSGQYPAVNLPALRAYWLALLGLVPPLGLLLGPPALLLGLRARRRGPSDPEFTAVGPALAAVILGVAVTLTSWAGAALMYLGLRDAGVL
jgi:hypothetical protein